MWHLYQHTSGVYDVSQGAIGPEWTRILSGTYQAMHALMRRYAR